MPKAKTVAKKKSAKASVKAAPYRPSNLSIFVIVLLLVALGTVTWLFLSLTNSVA